MECRKLVYNGIMYSDYDLYENGDIVSFHNRSVGLPLNRSKGISGKIVGGIRISTKKALSETFPDIVKIKIPNKIRKNIIYENQNYKEDIEIVYTNVVYGNIILDDYIIDNNFRIYKKDTGQLINKYLHSTGYYVYTIVLKDVGSRPLSEHRIIGSTFLNVNKLDMDKYVVNHIDGIKTNNKIENLEIITRQENNEHAIIIGLTTGFSFSKLSDEDRKYIKENFKHGHRQFGYSGLGRKFGVHSHTIKRVLEDYQYKYFQKQVII